MSYTVHLCTFNTQLLIILANCQFVSRHHWTCWLFRLLICHCGV